MGSTHSRYIVTVTYIALSDRPTGNASTGECGDAATAYAKGAPETIADLCRFSTQERSAMLREVDVFSAQGMRLLQIWVPDTRSPEFAKEARRQSRAVARSKHAKEDQAFVDSISAWLWEDK